MVKPLFCCDYGKFIEIGEGSVITKDIPPNVIGAGNLCRLISKITEEDKRYWEEIRDQYLKMRKS